VYEMQRVDRLIQIDALITVYDFVRPKGFYFQGESHDFWECVYIRQGEVTATADERVYQLGEGKLLLHKPMEFHRIWSGEDCAPWIINISFRARGILTERLAGCFDLRPKQKERLLEITEVFTRLEALKNAGEDCQMLTNLTAVLLEAFLLDLAETESISSPSQLPQDERYTRIVRLMMANCRENLSLGELAQLCQMSVSNMKRIFRQYSDVGIAKYYLTLRIRYAMELLEKGMPANQVAEQLNFPDSAYFYTVFKRETSLTPAQYRRQKVQQAP